MNHAQVTLTISNIAAWTNINIPEVALTKRGATLKPELQYSITGLDSNAEYNVQLKISQNGSEKQKYYEHRGTYDAHSNFENNEALPAPQHAMIPKFANVEWVKGSELAEIDFSKVKFSSIGGAGDVTLRSIYRYEPSVVILERSSGFLWEFAQPIQQFIGMTGAKKIRDGKARVPIATVDAPQPEVVNPKEVRGRALKRPVLEEFDEEFRQLPAKRVYQRVEEQEMYENVAPIQFDGQDFQGNQEAQYFYPEYRGYEEDGQFNNVEYRQKGIPDGYEVEFEHHQEVMYEHNVAVPFNEYQGYVEDGQFEQQGSPVGHEEYGRGGYDTYEINAQVHFVHVNGQGLLDFAEEQQGFPAGHDEEQGYTAPEVQNLTDKQPVSEKFVLDANQIFQIRADMDLSDRSVAYPLAPEYQVIDGIPMVRALITKDGVEDKVGLEDHTTTVYYRPQIYRLALVTLESIELPGKVMEVLNYGNAPAHHGVLDARFDQSSSSSLHGSPVDQARQEVSFRGLE